VRQRPCRCLGRAAQPLPARRLALDQASVQQSHHGRPPPPPRGLSDHRLGGFWGTEPADDAPSVEARGLPPAARHQLNGTHLTERNPWLGFAGIEDHRALDSLVGIIVEKDRIGGAAAGPADGPRCLRQTKYDPGPWSVGRTAVVSSPSVSLASMAPFLAPSCTALALGARGGW
jgi:hypothetical protein